MLRLPNGGGRTMSWESECGGTTLTISIQRGSPVKRHPSERCGMENAAACMVLHSAPAQTAVIDARLGWQVGNSEEERGGGRDNTTTLQSARVMCKHLLVVEHEGILNTTGFSSPLLELQGFQISKLATAVQRGVAWCYWHCNTREALNQICCHSAAQERSTAFFF